MFWTGEFGEIMYSSDDGDSFDKIFLVLFLLTSDRLLLLIVYLCAKLY